MGRISQYPTSSFVLSDWLNLQQPDQFKKNSQDAHLDVALGIYNRPVKALESGTETPWAELRAIDMSGLSIVQFGADRALEFVCTFGVGQMLATILILFIARLFRLVQFPSLDSSIPRKIMPLPLLYFFNLISGLGGTQMINLPMFTVLRRFSILMTMILEFYILNVKASRAVKISVGLMILGSFIAAIYDLTFDTVGYTMIFVNNICTAALGVYTKQKLDAKDLGKYGLMFYNCLFMVLPALCVVKYTGDFDKSLEFFKSEMMTSSVWIAFILS